MPTIRGTNKRNILTGTLGADTLLGFGGNDALLGLTGNDTLDGGTGADIMTGGKGNDTYIADNAGDRAIEKAGEGIDLVKSSVTHSLGLNVENLTLTGLAAINGTGNAVANIITGNGARNTLNGGRGADKMLGGKGHDTYVVDHASDQTIEGFAQGTDLVTSSITRTLGLNIENLTLTGAAALNGTGNTLANIITGNAGNNILNGGTGADRMLGGKGNDTYIVDNAGDTAIEGFGQGTDLVISSVSHVLGLNVENLTLTGLAAINGTGNALANIITGNDVANVLNGGAGADTMAGVGGDDTFIVDDAGDTASGGAGTDTVQSSVTVTLGADVENLILTGAAAINGTGNSLANIIIGNAAANVIEGGTGLDSLDGGDGGDTYVFRPGDIVAGLVGRTIVDSGTTGTDTIRIDTSPGPSQTLSFRASAVAGLEAIAFTGGGIGVLRFNASQLSGPIDVAFSAANMQVIQILDATNFLGNTWTFSTPLYTSTSIEVFGTTAADTLTGTLSNDTLNGDGGADVLDGREGSDIYSYSQASDFVSGEFIKDTGTSGNDQLVISTVDYVAVDFTLASALSDFTTLETVYLGAEGSGAIFNASQVGLNWQIVDESSFQFIVINNATNINLQNWVFSNFEENGDTIYINGTGGGDTIIGTNKTDIITGGGGIDFLNGEAGIDFLAGGAAADILFGGLGDDEYLLDTGDLAAGEVIQDVFVQNVPLGGGFDTVKITGSGFFNFQLATLANIEQLTLAGSSLSIALKSSQAQQLSQINTTTLVQEFISVYLDSTSFDGSGITVVNWIPGSTDFDSFTIQGTASSDTISGTNVGEYIVGQGGADTIRGGGGADVLQGSGGADKFKYVSFAESTTGGIDMIQDFSGTGLDGDQIDLTDLVDGAIAFVGSGPFFGGSTPAVRYVDGATDRVVQCDADGNGTADLFITLEGQSGAAAMVSTDFLL